MKIDNGRTNFDQVGAVRAEALRADKAKEAAKAGKTGPDQVTVSTTSQLAQSAAAAAESAPEIRPDVVERAKALLQSGELGKDAERLADAIIDEALQG